MWDWDQGHLAYFQFDALRRISSFIVGNDFKQASREELALASGLNFAAPSSHSPWRQYSRALKLALLISEDEASKKKGTLASPVAFLLSQPGVITADEYFHFLARAFTHPSPALEGWTRSAEFRYPLLFALKYLLAKRAISGPPFSTLDEVIGAYVRTELAGDEDEEAFIGAVASDSVYGPIGRQVPYGPRRQSKESLQVISQISYLHIEQRGIVVSLDPEDARDLFQDLTPILGPRSANREAELRRLADLFRDGATEDSFEYPHTVVNDAVLSGFLEGSKVKRTHMTIERNSGLREAFFSAKPTSICDVCTLNTLRTYPWTTRILDIHHLLPLASGTRVVSLGSGRGHARTTLDDLVPVCPSCHRAVHRFYDLWLRDRSLSDFPNEMLAREAYSNMKSQFRGTIHA